MATTIVASPLTIKISEQIKLGGVELGGEVTKRIQSITEFSRRLINVPTSEVVILAMSTAVAAGQYVESTVKYIRITNLDAANHVTLVFRSENNAECAHKLDFGYSFIYAADDAGGVVDTHDASASALSVSLDDLVDITALANSGAVDLEVIVAGT
jgi:hypothetical protein|tara:strand:+ start:398 stop:865 length:468 start_codon:yes stop_codon:yes gene_type:complete